MPYIKAEDYTRAVEAPAVPGELNYAITLMAISRLSGGLTFHEFGDAVRALVDGYLLLSGLSYTNGNAVMGVLDCAARELRRRTGRPSNLNYTKSADIVEIGHQLGLERDRVYDTLLAPYEDLKIAENGDVYPASLLPDGR